MILGDYSYIWADDQNPFFIKAKDSLLKSGDDIYIGKGVFGFSAFIDYSNSDSSTFIKDCYSNINSDGISFYKNEVTNL